MKFYLNTNKKQPIKIGEIYRIRASNFNKYRNQSHLFDSFDNLKVKVVDIWGGGSLYGQNKWYECRIENRRYLTHFNVPECSLIPI